MQKLTITIRTIFGLFWLVFGLNGFLGFFPTPEPSKAAADFMHALTQAGYVMPLVYATQIMAGLLLLSNQLPAIALITLAPVVANIVLYDLFLNKAGLAIGLVILALYLFLLYANRYLFVGLFTTKR